MYIPQLLDKQVCFAGGRTCVSASGGSDFNLKIIFR